MEEIRKLKACFPGSSINQTMEVVLHEKFSLRPINVDAFFDYGNDHDITEVFPDWDKMEEAEQNKAIEAWNRRAKRCER